MATFLTTDGVNLSYTDEGAGRPVVLIHGYTAPATAWALTVDALLAAGHRVVCFDRRGHGESETPAYGQRMARHGRDLGELLEHLQLDDVSLVGASMGGNTIWAYVDQFGSARIRSAVVVDQTPKMLNSEDWPYGFYGYNAPEGVTMFAAGVPRTDRGRAPEKSAEALGRLVARLGGPPPMRDPAAPETIKLLTDHALADWRDVAERFDRPYLMMAADQSQVWPAGHAAATVAGNPHGRAVTVADSGHAISFDQPDRFNELLVAFLTEPSSVE